MLPVLCFVFLLMVVPGQSLAQSSSDQYVDTIIHSALQNVIRDEKLDPTSLPDYTFEYKDKTFFGNVKGKADYTEGTVTGLSKIWRSSYCQGPRNTTEGTVIHCVLSFSSLLTSYKGKVKYGVLPKVTIHAKGNFQLTEIDVEFVKPLNQRTQVTSSFRFAGLMNTEFSGLGPLNKHMKVLEENYKKIVMPEVRNVISNRFRYALEMAANQIPMPLS